MDPRAEFIKAAIWHGNLKKAEDILAANASAVHDRSPPFDGDALNYLCLSKYPRLKPERSEASLRAATALLDAGANPRSVKLSTRYEEFDALIRSRLQVGSRRKSLHRNALPVCRSDAFSFDVMVNHHSQGESR